MNQLIQLIIENIDIAAIATSGFLNGLWVVLIVIGRFKKIARLKKEEVREKVMATKDDIAHVRQTTGVSVANCISYGLSQLSVMYNRAISSVVENIANEEVREMVRTYLLSKVDINQEAFLQIVQAELAKIKTVAQPSMQAILDKVVEAESKVSRKIEPVKPIIKKIRAVVNDKISLE
jgi:hypothetical protein